MEEATKADILAALDDSGKRFVSMVRGLDPDRAARPVPQYGLELAAIDSGADTSGSTYSKSYLTLED